jgi:uncharacterized protein YbaR (Trm112 family)
MFAAGTLFAAACEAAQLNRATRAHRPKPPRRGLVVEVGGGQSPHPRTELVIEKYVADDFERPGGESFSFSKPLIVGDGHRLPLATGSAAYVIASHVLEHATDPAEFASELARVGAAGFVQVPSRESELTYGWPFHSWLIDRDEDVLVFTARRKGQTAPVGALHHELYASTALARLAFELQRTTWHHSVEWCGELSVRVAGISSAPEKTASFDLEATIKTLEAADMPPLPPNARAALACPVCRSSIELKESATCVSCGRKYPVANGVPILIEEVAVELEFDRSNVVSAVAV